MAMIYWRSSDRAGHGEQRLGDATRIGRAKDNELFLLDERLSRHHLRIVRVGEDFFVEDLESRNGTLLNGEKVARAKLARGDEIHIGGTVIRFEAPFDASDVTPPAAPAARPATRGDAPFVVLQEGADHGKTFSLRGDRVVVGRKTGCGVVVSDFRVSGEHAVFEARGGGWFLRDLESKNGTFINGARIACEAVDHGDMLSIGGVPMQFLLPGRPVPPPRHGALAQEGQAVARLQLADADLPQGRQALLTAVLITALGAVFLGGYGAAMHFFGGSGLDAPEAGNLVGEAFSFENGAGTPDGWRSLDGAALARVPGGLPPGRFAGALAAAPPAPDAVAAAEAENPIAVVPGSWYRLQGYVAHEGPGASAIAVAWFEDEEPRWTSLTDVCRPGTRLFASGTFVSPPRCERAVVRLVTFGSGKGTFDRLDLRAVGAVEEDDGTGTVAAGAGSFGLNVAPSGMFDLSVGSETILGYGRLVFGGALKVMRDLPGQELGAGSASRVVEPDDESPARRIVNVRQVYVPEADVWTPLQSRFTLAPDGGSVTWAYPRASAADALPVAIVMRLPDDPLGGGARFTAYGPAGAQSLKYAELAGIKASELVIGGVTVEGSGRRRGRVVLTFPGMGTLIPHGREFVLTIEKEVDMRVRDDAREVVLSWSFSSVHEERRAREAMTEAQKLASAGRDGTALRILSQAVQRYGGDDALRRNLEQRTATLRAAFDARFAQAEAMRDVLARRGDEEIAQALAAFLDDLKTRASEAPEWVARVDALRAQIRSREHRTAGDDTEQSVEETLEQIKTLFQKRSYAAASLLAQGLLDGGNGGIELSETARRAVTELLDMCARRLRSKSDLPPVIRREASS